MAIGVVDALESVDVENHQRQQIGHRDRGGFHQRAPIGKAGERIGEAQRIGLQLGPIEFEVRLADRARDGRRERESDEHRNGPRAQAGRPVDEKHNWFVTSAASAIATQTAVTKAT